MPHLDIHIPIKEIMSDATRLVKIDERVINEIVGDDPNPQYVVVEIPEGKSGNNILYERDNLQDICEQINANLPVGYLGHKHFQGEDKEDLLPPPQTIWLAATVVTENGKARLITKGYNYAWAEIRNWLKGKAVNSVSWSADAVLTPLSGGGYKPKKIMLESLDWSRKNRAGIAGQKLTVVTEMQGSSKEGEGSVDDDTSAATIISKLVFADLNSGNPQLVRAIKEMQKSEDDQEKLNALADKEKELKDAFELRLASIPEISTIKKLREVLKIADDISLDNIPGMVVALMEKFEGISKKLVKNWFEEDVLKEKVEDEKARKIVGRLVAVTEMQGDWLNDDGIKKLKKDIVERLDEVLEKDEDVRSVIKEMSSRGGARMGGKRREDLPERSGNNDNNDDKKLRTNSKFTEVVEVQLGR